MNRRCKILALLFSTLLVSPAHAQVETWIINRGPGNFFICILAGVLLALAFHVLLTSLAAALGISTTSDVRKGSSHKSDSSSGGHSTSVNRGAKFTSALGAAMTLSFSISLFFASLFALNLVAVPSYSEAAILALVIWAAYLLIGLYLNVRFFTHFTGSVLSMVKGAVGGAVTALAQLFTPSRKSMIKDTAGDVVETLRREIRQEFDFTDIEDKLDEYVSKLAPQKFDTDSLQRHLVDLIHEIEVREKVTPDDPDATRRLFLEVAEKQGRFSGQDRQRLADAFDSARKAAKTEGGRSDKALAAVDKLSPGSEAQAKEYRGKVEQYLRDAKLEELDPDRLKEDLEKILTEPGGAPEVIRHRISQLDRSTLEGLLAAREGITEEKARRYVDKAEELLERLRGSSTESAQRASASGNKAMDKAGEMTEAGKDRLEETQERARQAIIDWFDRMERPEVSYDALKYDARRILDDPSASPEVLRKRLQRMDRETLTALLSNNSKISSDQAERFVSHLEEARDEVVRKTTEIEKELEHRLEEARQEVLRQAEATRKTAVSASWWMAIAMTVSALASVLGGVVAVG